MSVEIEYRWTDLGNSFHKKLTEFAKKGVYVGFPDSAGTHKRKGPKKSKKDGKQAQSVTVAQVAAWNEFGTIHMPARPFMKQTVTENKEKFGEMLKLAGQEVLQGTDTTEALNKVGVVAKALMQKQIDEGSFAPNAPSTIKMKGSSKPLIDTGQMRQSVNYVVR